MFCSEHGAPLQPLQWSSAVREPDDRSAKQCRAGNRMRIGLLSRPVVGGTVAGSMMAERAAPASDRHERVRMAGCRAEAGGRGGGASGPFPVSTAHPPSGRIGSRAGPQDGGAGSQLKSPRSRRPAAGPGRPAPQPGRPASRTASQRQRQPRRAARPGCSGGSAGAAAGRQPAAASDHGNAQSLSGWEVG